MLRKTTEQFVAKARQVHGDKYDYSLVEYTTRNHQVAITCPLHGQFWQKPHAHLCGRGCHRCAGTASSNTTDFIAKASVLHGDRYDYSLVEYAGVQKEVIIICRTHGPFNCRPNDHISSHKSGCPKCADTRQSTVGFVANAIALHGDRYDYSLIQYTNNHTKVTIVCGEHGPFTQTPNSHLRGSGCPTCISIGYSQKSLQWLNRLSAEQNISIQHAENDGEFRIPGTRIRVDGYCKETNTIYEFHGDAYHGNPLRYQADSRCHPHDRQITAGELYQRTIIREEKIRSLGYKLVVMWESDFDSTHNAEETNN